MVPCECERRGVGWLDAGQKRRHRPSSWVLCRGPWWGGSPVIEPFLYKLRAFSWVSKKLRTAK